MEPVIGKKQLPRDAIERQHFVDKGVVHSARCIDVDLQMGLFAAAELHDAVRGHVRRAMEAIRDNELPKLGLDPHDRFRWLQGRLHIGDADFAAARDVTHSASADPLVPRDAQLFQRPVAITESEIWRWRCSSRRRGSASGRARACRRRARWPGRGSPHGCQANVRRALPFPFAEERLETRRREEESAAGNDRTLEVQPEVVRRIEQVGAELAAAVPEPDITQHRALPSQAKSQVSPSKSIVL